MSVGGIAGVFLRLGATAFGGPAAHIALMRSEFVDRRRWLSEREFLDFVGATNLIPGPNSTEVALHIGHARAGMAGLVAAGLGFILPSALLVAAAAAVYVRFGTLPDVVRVFYGIKPVVIALVAQALWSLGRTALGTPLTAAIGIAAFAAVAMGVHELAVLAAAALMCVGVRRANTGSLAVAIVPALPATAAAAAAAVMTPGLGPVFAVFAKIGSVLFGSGYVLMAFLRADLVERLGWISERQLLDAIAVGQVTPGPLFTTATFIGYIVAGAPGAVAATAGIFLPAFVFVAISGPLVPRLRRSPVAAAALDGVNAASLALMALVTWQLGRAALVDALTLTLCITSLLVLMRYRLNPMWLTVAGALVGWVMG